MNRLGSIAHIAEVVSACRNRCREQGVPFYADALAASLGISYDRLARYAAGEDTSPTVAKLLAGAVQECTASVLEFALKGDQKQHSFYMWYLKNRGGFSDKPVEAAPAGCGTVVFMGESRI